MIVIGIIALLAAVVLPAYQDYVIRAQVAEGLALSGPAKIAITEYYQENRTWPENNEKAGLADAHDITGHFTEHLKVNDNVIEIKYEYDANPVIHKKRITLTAAVTAGGSIVWTCAPKDGENAMPPKFLPASCR
jgi:type IV pilus assembly protein PilA